MKLLVDKLSTDAREDVIRDIKEFVGQKSEHRIFHNIVNSILNELQQNIEAENFQDDQNWFQGLNSVPAAYKNTKSDVMRYLSQQRIRGYYHKIKEKTRVSCFNRCLCISEVFRFHVVDQIIVFTLPRQFYFISYFKLKQLLWRYVHKYFYRSLSFLNTMKLSK